MSSVTVLSLSPRALSEQPSAASSVALSEKETPLLSFDAVMASIEEQIIGFVEEPAYKLNHHTEPGPSQLSDSFLPYDLFDQLLSPLLIKPDEPATPLKTPSLNLMLPQEIAEDGAPCLRVPPTTLKIHPFEQFTEIPTEHEISTQISDNITKSTLQKMPITNKEIEKNFPALGDVGIEIYSSEKEKTLPTDTHFPFIVPFHPPTDSIAHFLPSESDIPIFSNSLTIIKQMNEQLAPEALVTTSSPYADIINDLEITAYSSISDSITNFSANPSTHQSNASALVNQQKTLDNFENTFSVETLKPSLLQKQESSSMLNIELTLDSPELIESTANLDALQSASSPSAPPQPQIAVNTNEPLSFAESAAPSTTAHPQNAIDESAVFKTVFKQLQTVPQTPGETHLHIQLYPEELGVVDVRIDIDKQGGSRVHFTAETQSVRDVLMGYRHDIQHIFDAANLSLDTTNLSFFMQSDQQQHTGESHESPQHTQPRLSIEEPQQDDIITPTASASSKLVDVLA